MLIVFASNRWYLIQKYQNKINQLKSLEEDDENAYRAARYQLLNNIVHPFVMLELKDLRISLVINNFIQIVQILMEIPINKPQNLTINFNISTLENSVDFPVLLELLEDEKQVKNIIKFNSWI